MLNRTGGGGGGATSIGTLGNPDFADAGSGGAPATNGGSGRVVLVLT
ncbi:hypothetical protein K0651_02210 [Ornithinimicrobium sp. Arc0846-15]|nr:hypothetical protein [Ornithinimicrobium laminariae]